MNDARKMTYLRRRASQERTAALHEPNSVDREEHTSNAEKYEERVRDIAMGLHDRSNGAVSQVDQSRFSEW
jgi:hypothetical protein